VVVASEFTKLCLATIMFLRDNGDFGVLRAQFVEHKQLLGYYLVPAGLYAALNNLVFINLRVRAYRQFGGSGSRCRVAALQQAAGLALAFAPPRASAVRTIRLH
jgi:hypothetical protein